MDNLVPQTGAHQSVIDRLLGYIIPFNPNFLQQIRGAPIDMISLYGELSGFGNSINDLPIAYTKFLLSMGLDDGGLLKNFRIQARLPSLIKLYQDCLRSEPESLNRDLPIVATYIIGDQISLDRSQGLPEPEVVETSDGELIAKLSRSWECLLMQAAILQVEPRRLPFGRWFSSSANSAARALSLDEMGKQSASASFDLLAEKLDFGIAWPSDSRHRIAVGMDSSLFANIETQNEIMLYVFSQNENFLRKIENEALKIFGASGGMLRLINGELRASE